MAVSPEAVRNLPVLVQVLLQEGIVQPSHHPEVPHVINFGNHIDPKEKRLTEPLRTEIGRSLGEFVGQRAFHPSIDAVAGIPPDGDLLVEAFLAWRAGKLLPTQLGRIRLEAREDGTAQLVAVPKPQPSSVLLFGTTDNYRARRSASHELLGLTMKVTTLLLLGDTLPDPRSGIGKPPDQMMLFQPSEFFAARRKLRA